MRATAEADAPPRANIRDSTANMLEHDTVQDYAKRAGGGGGTWHSDDTRLQQQLEWEEQHAAARNSRAALRR